MYRLELTYFVALAYYGSGRLLVMGTCLIVKFGTKCGRNKKAAHEAINECASFLT